MRHYFLFIFLLSIFIGKQDIIAQDDSAPYFLYEEGTKVKIGHYNKRKIPQAFTVYTVKNVIKTDSIDYITISVESQDKYQKPLNSFEFEAELEDGNFAIEKTFLIPIDTLAAIEENDWNIDGRDYIMPAFIATGIELSAAFVSLETDDNKYYQVSQFSRQVEKFETLETEVGEYETCVVSSKLELQLGEPEIYTVFTWYAKGIGPIRVNYYNKKRKFVKYSEIVEIIQPEKS